MSQSFQQQLNSTNAIVNDRSPSYFAQAPQSTLRSPRILNMVPAQGQAGQSFQLSLDNLDPTLDLNSLWIAFHNCSTTCQISIDNVTQAVTMTTTVPPPNLVATDDLSRVPINLEAVILDTNNQQQHNKVVVRWFVGYFAYSPATAPMATTSRGTSRKRSSGEVDDPADNDSNRPTSYEGDVKRFRNEENLQGQTTYITQPYSATYYQFPPQQQTPYVGLPSNQSSQRAREYFEEPALYSYVPPNNSSNFTSPYSTQGYVNQPHTMQQQQQEEAPPQPPPNQSPYLMQMMDPALSHSPRSFSPSINSPSLSSPTTLLPHISQTQFQMRPPVYQLSSPQSQQQQLQQTSPYTLMPSTSYPAPSPSAPSLTQHSQQQLPQPPPPLSLPQSTHTATSNSAASIPSSYHRHQASSSKTTTASSIEPQTRTLPEDYINTFKNGANLILHGDLKDMTRDWTATEQRERRRLVQFTKSRSGNNIDCWFKPHALSSSPPQFQPYASEKGVEGGNETVAATESSTSAITKLPEQHTKTNHKDIIVSCIYWEAMNDYFVTSVDCIQLIEALVDGRFTVEEKNRVRRNLENYKPLTVSKMNPDTNDFFRLIMGYPNPKPRNIEKDVKVFQWVSLGTAIEKVLKKYSASFSSIHSVNYEEFLNAATT